MASLSTARAEAAAGRSPNISVPGKLRIIARTVAIVVILLPAVAFHFVWRFVRAPSPWPRLFLGACARIAGARVERRGTPLRADVIFIANHVSWIDILAIAGVCGSAFVAKAEIRAAPIVGWLATLNSTIFVAREDRLGVAAQIALLRQAIAETWSVTIFPEGTTTDGRSLLPFKSTLLKVLEPAPSGVRVQPVFLDYGTVGPDIAWIGVERGRANALRVLARRGSFPLIVRFLESFSPADFPGRKAIAAESRARIAQAMSAVLGTAVPLFVGHDVWAGTRLPFESNLATVPTAL